MILFVLHIEICYRGACSLLLKYICVFKGLHMKKLAWLALSASVLLLPTAATAGTFGKMLGGLKQLQGGTDTQQQSAHPSSSSKSTKSRTSSQPELSVSSPSPTAAVSENTVAIPQIHFDHPVQVFEKGKWYTGTVANLNYDNLPPNSTYGTVHRITLVVASIAPE